MDFLKNNSTSSSTVAETPFTRKIKFGVFLTLEPPALVCNFLLVYHLISDRTLRAALHNHVILALLMVTLLTNLVEIPRVLHYLHIGIVTPPNHVNCLIWQWFDYSLSAQTNLIMLWASFERHLLVFHAHFFSSAKRRLYTHYLPLLMIIVYLILFYIGIIFTYPCEEEFDFSAPLCGAACYTNYSIISLYDLFAHSFLPVCFIALLSVGLVVRVLYGKRIRRHQPVQWRKHRKMILQLLCISCLFLACVVPSTLVRFIEIFAGLTDFGTYVEMIYFFYLFWLLALLLPFVCIGCLPEVVKKIRKQLIGWMYQNNAVTFNIANQSRHRVSSRSRIRNIPFS